jgi:phytoene/squalene synthetase
LYLPLETLERAGCTEADFGRGVATDALRRAMGVEVDRAETYLRGGMELVELVPRELRVEVSLFLAGGLSVVDAIRRQDYDVWRRRPTVSTAKKLRLLVGCWWNAPKFLQGADELLPRFALPADVADRLQASTNRSCCCQHKRLACVRAAILAAPTTWATARPRSTPRHVGIVAAPLVDATRRHSDPLLPALADTIENFRFPSNTARRNRRVE